uniref:Uncharacterized protein n=1 Tax=Oryza rufipogon TaxID=4529 RepID=A0A0E0RCZ0_ORYRU
MVMSPGGLELATPEEGSDEAGSRRPKTPALQAAEVPFHHVLCRSIIFPDNSYMISIHDDKIEKFSTLKNRTGISSAQNNTRLDKNWR